MPTRRGPRACPSTCPPSPRSTSRPGGGWPRDYWPARSRKRRPPASAALARRAHELGKEIGETVRRTGDTTVAVLRTLRDFGFEPRADGDTVVLVNCPFHTLAQHHTELVCGMNLRLVDGVLDGLAATGLTTHLAPRPGRCCVQLRDQPST